MLSAAASSDPDGDPLSYAWRLVQKPKHSAAILSGATDDECELVPDKPGAYLIELVVNDGFADSAPDSATIRVITLQKYIEQTVKEALALVKALPAGSFSSKADRKEFEQILKQALDDVRNDKLRHAQKELQNAIERTDGCALRGQPDTKGSGRDWITDCASQAPVYAQLRAALDAIAP